MEDLTALFHQYETDYCNKSTDISRKISSLASITGGVHAAVLCFCQPQ
jgi:vesicle transport through interaction with t-SNAREs protein 1